ncbi:hypothetical protein [Brevundimonas diminuta]|uniref:hypothetical protein n=1 Tax=Brevundimonas diminuta TaxID=293 RepID=UPI003CFE402D
MPFARASVPSKAEGVVFLDLKKQALDYLRYLLVERDLVFPPAFLRRCTIVVIDYVEPQPLGGGALGAALVPVRIRGGFNVGMEKYVGPEPADTYAEALPGMGAAAGLAAETGQFREDARQDSQPTLLHGRRKFRTSVGGKEIGGVGGRFSLCVLLEKPGDDGVRRRQRGGRLDGFDGGADFDLDLRKIPEDWSLRKRGNILSIRLIDFSTFGDVLISRKVIRQCER